MRWSLPVLLLVALSATVTHAEETLGVLLKDGRFATGSLDSATDATRLWINSTDHGIALRSSFDWNRIVTVVHQSKQHSAAEFKTLVSQLPGSIPALPESEPIAVVTGDVAASTIRPPLVRPINFLEPPPIRSLRIRAWAANWDSDPELDGVLVEITPLGPSGEFVPVDGMLSMTLIGENSRPHPEHLRQFRPRYPEVAQTSIQVSSEHFDGGHAVYQLPYQNLNPEDHLDLFPQGVVTATLGVSGQGNFTASTDALSLIPASPIRDRRQQLFGRRYFPQELSNLRNPSRFGDDRKTTDISLGYALP